MGSKYSTCPDVDLHPASHSSSQTSDLLKGQLLQLNMQSNFQFKQILKRSLRDIASVIWMTGQSRVITTFFAGTIGVCHCHPWTIEVLYQVSGCQNGGQQLFSRHLECTDYMYMYLWGCLVWWWGPACSRVRYIPILLPTLMLQGYHLNTVVLPWHGAETYLFYARFSDSIVPNTILKGTSDGNLWIVGPLMTFPDAIPADPTQFLDVLFDRRRLGSNCSFRAALVANGCHRTNRSSDLSSSLGVTGCRPYRGRSLRKFVWPCFLTDRLIIVQW